jgi:hypothetical protein
MRKLHHRLTRVKTAAVLILACALVMLIGVVAAPAFAEGGEPWWRVTTKAAPSDLAPGSIDQVLVTANNLGDGEASGSSAPIVVSDKLPPGIVPVGIRGTVGPFGTLGGGECSLETVSCTFGQEIPPYLGASIELTVRVGARAGSGVNEAVAEGGGAARVVKDQSLTVSEASTSFGVEDFELTPESVGGVPDPQAGSHPFQLTSTLDLNQQTGSGIVESAGLAKDLRFYLPPGLVGNPNAVPQCTSREFATTPPETENTCPQNTVVGVANTTLIIPYISPNPVTVPVPVNDLVPQVGEPARFGFVIAGDPVILDTSVRTGGDYGVVVKVGNISQNLDLLASQVTLWGVPGDPRHNSARGSHCLFFGSPCEPLNETNPQPMLTLPTSCSGPWAPTVSVDSWTEPAEQRTGEYTLRDQYGDALGLSGCNRLTFEPSIVVAADGQAGSTPTGLTATIHVPQTAGLNPNGDAQATVRETTVTLPEGVALNPSAADGLSSCGESEVGLEDAEEATCPESSKVGTVEIHTPLLPNPLVGAAYLAMQDQNPFGSLIALYIVARDPAARHDVQEHAGSPVRRLQPELLWGLTGAVEHSTIMRRLCDDGVVRAMVGERAGGIEVDVRHHVGPGQHLVCEPEAVPAGVCCRYDKCAGRRVYAVDDDDGSPRRRPAAREALDRLPTRDLRGPGGREAL